LTLSLGSAVKIEQNGYFAWVKVLIDITWLQKTKLYYTFIQPHFLGQLLDQAGSRTGFHAPVTPPPELFLWGCSEDIMS
jgi:hypothetical protein